MQAPDFSAAVTDPRTGAAGSITKFVEIANLASGKLTASSLIVSKPRSENDNQDETASLVQRRFTSNGRLNYDCVVYNCGTKGKRKAEVEVVLVIKKGNAALR